MIKKCEKCGTPAPDDETLFCNKCGTPMPETHRPVFPVCTACGSVVSDDLAQFCNRCGLKLPEKPPVCTTCGTPAIDNQSLFCTRCGTGFARQPVNIITVYTGCGNPAPDAEAVFCNRCGSVFPGRTARTILHEKISSGQTSSPVVIALRRDARPPPGPVDNGPVVNPMRRELPDGAEPLLPDFESQSPPSDPSFAERTSTQPVSEGRNDVATSRRYAHLPLIADELRAGGAKEPYPDPRTGAVQSKSREGASKKGILGFLKKKERK